MSDERTDSHTATRLQGTRRLSLSGIFAGKGRQSLTTIDVNASEALEGASGRKPGIVLPTRSRRFGFSGYVFTFVGCVLLPAFLVTLYFLFFASDQFMAETRFAVRKAQSGNLAGDKLASAAASMGGTGGTSSNSGEQEAYIIANYLRSRAAIEEIQKNINIIDIFQRPEGDFWARLKQNPSIEDLTKYWQSMVHTYVDGPSVVVYVSARAFRPNDAKQLVETAIKVSERLANQLSERARIDAMQKSETEVRRTEALVRDALLELRRYRDEEGLITPQMEATSTSKLLMEAMSEQIKLQNDYFVAVRALSPDAPSLRGIKTRLESLEAEIVKLKSQLTNRSGDTRSISASLVRFEELELRRAFSERMYVLAQEALERSRLKAEQQAVYISVFVPPHLPQEARFPERYSMSIIISVGLTLIWSVLALTAAAIQDHKL